jgi:hypothetical protein
MESRERAPIVAGQTPMPPATTLTTIPQRVPPVGGRGARNPKRGQIVHAWGGASCLLRLVLAEPPPSKMALVIAIEGPPAVLVIARAAMEKGRSSSPPYLSSFTPRIRRHSMSQSTFCVSITCEVDSPSLNFVKQVVYLKLWYCRYIRG